jgi:peptide/nickel transport system ATP-binding protein
MYAGNVVESALTAEMFKNPVHPYSRGLLASVPRLTGKGIGKGIEGLVPDYFHTGQGCRFYPRCDISVEECPIYFPPMFTVAEHHEVACFGMKKRLQVP